MVDKTQSTQQFDTGNNDYYHCCGPEEGKMIECDNPDSSIPIVPYEMLKVKSYP